MKKVYLPFVIACFTFMNVYAQTCTINLSSAVGTDAQTLCKGASISDIQYSFDGGSASVNGLPAGVTGSVTTPGNLGVFTLSGTPSVAGNYTYTITTNGACSSQSELTGTITVNSTNISVTDAVVCEGMPATLTANGADAYTWSTGKTTASITVTPSVTTSFTVTGTTAGCSNNAVGSITVAPLPIVIVNSPTICAGEGVFLTANGADAYTWSTGETTSSINVTPPSGNTSYTVTGTGTTAGCSGSTVATVTVQALPTISVNSVIMCAGETATLAASGGSTYSWTPGGETTGSIQVSPSATTSYTVTGTAAVCSNEQTVVIVVQPVPLVLVNSPTICAGETATLTASGANTYIWSNTASNSTISVIPSTTTTYSVTGTNLGCSAMTIGTVTVLSSPCSSTNNLTISVNSTDASSNVACDGKAFASVNGGVPPYSITFSGNTTVDSVLTIPNLCEGFYTVDAMDANSNTASFTFVISSPPTTFVRPIPTYVDSTAVDTLINNAFSNCDINYDLINSITISDFSLIAFDTVNIIWTVSHGTDSTTITEKYHFDFPGVYTAILQLFCTNRAIGIAKGIDQIYISGTTGIASYAEMNVSIFPNPFKTQVTVMVDQPAVLTIKNTQGVTLFSTTIKEGNTSIDTQEIPSGIYFISIENKEGVITEKLIKN